MSSLLTSNTFSQIALIHKKMLSSSDFLSECNVNFLAYFYNTIAESDSTILITEDYDENVKGFLFFTTDKENYMKNFLTRNFLSLLKFPSIYIPLIKASIRSFKSQRVQFYKNELVHIAVDSKFQGQGIGRKLLVELESILKERKINEYYLQVFGENIAAVSLYKKMGFETVRSFEKGSQIKYLMKKSVRSI
ncbi:ribosomal-protein-alanine N-acetyltransferase [bacterium BMS3Abin04]|nr:ribosomal-protein-alanine N-acetyltransferase [bacterium BMS3Abin04]